MTNDMHLAAGEQLECVRIGSDGVAEMDQHRVAVFIPRDQVLRLELDYGSGAERPIVLLALGIFCAALAVALMLVFVMAVARGGPRIPAALVTGFTFLIPGWRFIDLALRKRWFVRVHTDRGSRKLVFHTMRNQVEIEKFVSAAKSRCGYS